MSKMIRRDMLKTSALLILGAPFSSSLICRVASASTPNGSPSFPHLLHNDFEARIDLGPSIPTPSVTFRLEQMLIQASKSHHLSVMVEGCIAPVGDFDDRYSSWVQLCERYGVNVIIERSNREPMTTSPLRVGQTDPAGIVYHIVEK